MHFLRYVIITVSVLSLFSCSQSKKVAVKKDNTTNPYAEYKPNEVKFSNKKLQKFIESWYGSPYKFAGLNKEGVDCSGFVYLLMSDVYNKKVPRNTAQLASGSTQIKLSKIKEGDLVFFNIEGKKHSHVGVYIQNDKFVHASTKAGVTISSLNNPYYKKFFAGAARIK